MFPNNSSGISKKKPGPKTGSKRDPHARRPGPKRLIDQPNLYQQRLDMMSLFQSTSSSSTNVHQDQQTDITSSAHVKSSNDEESTSSFYDITTQSMEDGVYEQNDTVNTISASMQSIEETINPVILQADIDNDIYLNENNLDQDNIESNSDDEEGTESDEEVQRYNNVSDFYEGDPVTQEYTDNEFEIVDEGVGENTVENSAVDEYLTIIQNRLKGGSIPSEYQRKTYWVDVEYEGFDYDTRTDPSIFYRPRIFIWLPDLLTSNSSSGLGKVHLKCPECKVGKLERKEFAKKTKARRIIDQFDCFYLMSINYRCVRASCKKTFNGCNQSIVKQLNPGHQRAFPAVLTHKSGVSKELSNTMRPLFQHGVGPHRLSKIIRIMHTQRFDELQLVYYHGINDFKPNVISQLLNSGSETRTFEQFSEFSDKMKYNGYVPSSNYLSYVYSSLVAEYRLFTDQHTAQLGGIILKLDHSFKIIKQMGKINGISNFAALFTVLNEYGEIRMQLLVPSKHHSCLKPSFDNMMDSYRKFNCDMPQIAYTDNVSGDRKFLEEVIPSLTENVVHVNPSQAELMVRDGPYSSLPIASIPDNVDVTVFDNEEDINSACQNMLDMVSGDNLQLPVGFDIEWTPSFAYSIGVTARLTGSPIPVALVQIYFGTTIYLFRTYKFNEATFPKKLREVIESKKIIKIGRQIGGDMKKFSQYGIVNCPNQLELGTLCYEKEMATRRNYSLQRICGEVLKLNMPKPDNIRKSNWEMDFLSPDHIQYAAVDAFVSLEVYKKLKDLTTVKRPVTMPTPAGTFVALYASSADKAFPAALGYLRDVLSNEGSVARYQELRYPNSKYLIGMEVVKILIPGILLDRYKNGLSLDDFGEPKFIISVNRANLLTASESNYLSSLNDNASPISIIDHAPGTNYPPAIDSSNLPTVPSRVLKDAFHLLDLIKVSLRHGLSKDFIRRFRDALFVIDVEDKQKVEAYLVSIGTDWNTRLLSDPAFIFERVKRYIPPPDELYPMVKLVFDKYKNGLCSKTGLPLFDNEAVATSECILEEIRQGNVSDVVGGPPLYTEIGEDKNGLMRYRCSRGTSSVEGSVHFNIIRKFASYNAGTRLTDAVLSDYRLYHNISMGSITRHSKVHNSHFSPWISQAINSLRVKLGHEPIKNYFGNRLGNTFSYSQTNETFGITKLPLEIVRKYDMQPLDYTKSNFPAGIPLTTKRVFDLCILPVVKFPYLNYSGKQFLYRYLSHCQGTAFAVTAVHTKEETDLFEELIVSQHDLIFSENSQKPMFNVFAKIWSTHCKEDNNIFYKTEEHLNSHFNVIEDRKRYGNTVLLNIEISQFVRSVTQNATRCIDSLTVPAVTRPAPPSSDEIINLFSSSTNAENQNQEYRRIAPVKTLARPSFSSRHIMPKGSTTNAFTLAPFGTKRRKRDTCKVCGQNDCGGRSKRVFCVNKCGKCHNENCSGRYSGRNATVNHPCEFIS